MSDIAELRQAKSISNADIQAVIERTAQVADAWLDANTMRLRAGEMTAQEVRWVKVIVGSIAREIRTLKEHFKVERAA